MRQLFIYAALLLFCPDSFAQTRVFISAGGSLNTNYEPNTFFYPGVGNANWTTDGSYITKGLNKYWTFDLEIEKKVSKIYFVSGVHFFKSGYSNYFATNYSSFDCTHLGIPLLARINILNYSYLDLGPIGIMNLNATLEETALKGSVYEVHDKNNIAPYLSPFKLGFQLQYSLVINRFFITAYMTKMLVSVDPDLEKNWNLGGRYHNNSLFLREMSPNYKVFLLGLKLGVRIK
jgi:hypothetical protein